MIGRAAVDTLDPVSVSEGREREHQATVLVVDGDDVFRRGTVRTLADHGYSCAEATNRAEAHAVLDTDPSVVGVLCDIKTPSNSGLDLLKDLTADFPSVAVVMTTGLDDPHIADVAFDFGAFGYLIKPFDANELLIGLASALKRRELELAQRDAARASEQTIARTRILGGVLDGLERDPKTSLASDEQLIDRLARAVSLRDEETGRHIQRMSRYCAVLAAATGYTRLPLDDLRLATALHDVGKIGVPDGVLLKPGALTGDEHTSMQRHTQIGYQLLSSSTSELVRIAGEIAFTHHEWWDGGGYPRGLQGTEIPEEARIAAVADVFDALTSNRIYRPALPFEVAIAMMRELRGRQFEPRLLDAFFGLMDEVAVVRQAYPDVEDEQSRIRILVVDDHEIFAESLVRLLASKPELKVVGTAGSVSEAVTASRAYQPDVILMDFELPDGDGPQATEQIKALMPWVKVVMLTVRSDDKARVRAVAAGCSGFVKKVDSVDFLLGAIVAAHAGETIMPPNELQPLLRQLRPTHRGLGSDLTTREREILELLAAGLVNKDLAQRIGLSLNTVRNHVQNILYKLHAHSKLEAVATAVREGIISYPS
jgi:putative two-component system response regulator